MGDPTTTGPSYGFDKLTIINNALLATGNDPCQVADDNSDEWQVGSMAYERWVPVLLRRKNWPFAKTFADLTRVGDSKFPGFSDVYAKPASCLFLENAYRSDLASFVLPTLGLCMPDQDTRPPLLEYRIVSDQIHCVAPYGVTAIFIPFPTGAQAWTSGFVEALTLKIEAMIYRSLNDNSAEGQRCDRDAELAMEEEASRGQSEMPRRKAYRSSILERRRQGYGRFGYLGPQQPTAAAGTNSGSDFSNDFNSQDFGPKT